MITVLTAQSISKFRIKSVLALVGNSESFNSKADITNRKSTCNATKIIVIICKEIKIFNRIINNSDIVRSILRKSLTALIK